MESRFIVGKELVVNEWKVGRDRKKLFQGHSGEIVQPENLKRSKPHNQADRGGEQAAKLDLRV